MCCHLVVPVRVFLPDKQVESTRNALPSEEVVETVCYPQAVSTYINDFAQRIHRPYFRRIKELLEQMKRTTGIECTVVTIQSIKDYGAVTSSFEQFATGLFNAWSIGNKEKNNGIMLLVAVKDRKIRIELGAGYSKKYDEIVTKIIQERIIPCFKNDEYGRGIDEGVCALVKDFPEFEHICFMETFHLIIGIIFLIAFIWYRFSNRRSGRRGSRGRSSGGFGGGRSSGGGGGGW